MKFKLQCMGGAGTATLFAEIHADSEDAALERAVYDSKQLISPNYYRFALWGDGDKLIAHWRIEMVATVAGMTKQEDAQRRAAAGKEAI